MREAFFFGPSNQRVFAIYHPAATSGSGAVLTVICPPLFSDYMRTQPALRELAMALAEKGQHVLRFDYRGTGDSFGELGEVTVSDWLEDVALAVREGEEISGTRTVRLVGVRAGALLACAATRPLGEVKRLVLWDPVLDGAMYVEVLRRLQLGLSERNLYLSRSERDEARSECAGYLLSERMLEGLRLLDASVYSNVPKGILHIVSTSSEASFPVSNASRHVAQFECNWENLSDELITPRPVLEGVIECLTLP